MEIPIGGQYLHEQHEEPPGGLPNGSVAVSEPPDDQRREHVGVAPHRLPSGGAQRVERRARGLRVPAAAADAEEARAALGEGGRRDPRARSWDQLT